MNQHLDISAVEPPVVAPAEAAPAPVALVIEDDNVDFGIHMIERDNDNEIKNEIFDAMKVMSGLAPQIYI